MTSTCGSEFLADVARREFFQGLVSGCFLGLVIAGVFVAAIVSAALAEAGES